MQKQIYLDHAAGTPLHPAVLQVIQKSLRLHGNASAFNAPGREAAELIQSARTTVARFLGTRSEEIIFTASGSEANSLAILGLRSALLQNKAHIIVSAIEHPSVLAAAQQLKEEGVAVDALAVDTEGKIRVELLEGLLRKDTRLISVMYANNEIGTIQPIREIGKSIQAWRERHQTPWPLFHVDACQAAGYLDMNAHRLGADLVTFNGSKIYGPRGVGVLYKRRGVHLESLVVGGGQEHGLRAGTENVPAIVGLATALEKLEPEEGKRLRKIRDYFFERIESVVPDVIINGARDNQRLPNNIHISIPKIQSEDLLLELEKYGIAAGSGSACTARSVEPSHVLQAIGLPESLSAGALRLTMGRATKLADMKTLLEVLPKVVATLRNRYESLL